MTIEQVIELVEKWLADPSSVTVEELLLLGLLVLMLMLFMLLIAEYRELTK